MLKDLQKTFKAHHVLLLLGGLFVDDGLKLFMDMNKELNKAFVEVTNEITQITKPYNDVGINYPVEVESFIAGIRYARDVFNFATYEYQRIYFENKNADKS